MSPEKVRKTKSIANRLAKLATVADEWELKMANGGEIGSMLGEMANDLEQQTVKLAQTAAVREWI
jgi:hypothetical protein